ncbi:hypothetical protein Pint_33516 [Pistacia integerrima]|uniref:Uncharacterized protein n=1 Tax=Pistacia integerrima TaxID=434235 RepID=A0ACC0X4M0_9ROSI|nr:hypothetical protein Pint_33516 [Pistacia integerrima]
MSLEGGSGCLMPTMGPEVVLL